MRGQPAPGPHLGSVGPCSDPVGSSPCPGTPGFSTRAFSEQGENGRRPALEALLPSRDEPRSTEGLPAYPSPSSGSCPPPLSSPPPSLLPPPSVGTGKPRAKLRLHGFASAESWSPDSTEHSLPERLGWGRGRGTRCNCPQSNGRLHAQLSTLCTSSVRRRGAEPPAHPDSEGPGDGPHRQGRSAL